MKAVSQFLIVGASDLAGNLTCETVVICLDGKKPDCITLSFTLSFSDSGHN